MMTHLEKFCLNLCMNGWMSSDYCNTAGAAAAGGFIITSAATMSPSLSFALKNKLSVHGECKQEGIFAGLGGTKKV